MRNPLLTLGRNTLRNPLAWLGLLLAAGILWAEWGMIGDLARRWSTDPRYSHGFLVPLFAASVLWMRRDRFTGLAARPSWWGLPLLAAGAALQMAGAYFYVEWFEALALLPYAAGLCVLLFGPKSLRWAGPSIGFLIFMLPLPYRAEIALGGGLQALATKCSTYALQTVGMPAIAEGNVILMSEAKLGVAEACSGLGMLSTFVAFAVGTAMVIRRRRTDKALLIASSIPIAVLVNVARITVTGILHETVGSRLADLVFHDLAGWLMMPLALALLWAELLLLSHLLIEPEDDRLLAARLGLAAGGAAGPDPRASQGRLQTVPGR